MNIIIVDNEFFSDVRVCRQVRFLTKHLERVRVYCFRFDKSKPKVSTWQGAEVVAFYIPRPLKNLLYLLMNRLSWYETLWVRLVKRHCREDVKVIHAHDLYMSKIGKRLRLYFGESCKFFLDLHENYPAAIKSYSWANSGWRKKVVVPQKWSIKESKYLSYPDAILTLSASYANMLKEKYPRLKVDQWLSYPNYIDIKWFDSLTARPVIYPTEKRILFYFGAIARRRGVFDFLRVVASSEYLLDKFYIVLIGPVDSADEQTFDGLVNDERLKDNVQYISWIKLKDLGSYIDKADVCVAPFVPNPQHNSGVANKIYQYMYFAKPIVASNCIPQAKLIERAQNGLVFENRDQFEDILVSISLKSQEELKQMGENGRKYLLENCNGVLENKKLLALYHA